MVESNIFTLYLPADQCLAPAPPAELGEPGQIECETPEAESRPRGFYVAGLDHFYVDAVGHIFCIRGSGEPATLRRVDELPGNARVNRDAPADDVLWHLGRAVERAAELGGA